MAGNGYKTTWQKGQYQPDAFHAAGCGMVAGVSTPGVIGHATGMNVGTSYDLYENAATVPLYPYLAAASLLQVSSGSANDTAAGTGARTVTIVGLDANYNVISETLTMNGVTPVQTVNSYFHEQGDRLLGDFAKTFPGAPPDDNVHHARLVFQRHEHGSVRGGGTLADQHQSRDAHRHRLVNTKALKPAGDAIPNCSTFDSNRAGVSANRSVARTSTS